jgi:hypothetical protein
LKQARQRASRLFLKDGARSSLPQYLQTSFSVLDAARDDRGGRPGAFVVFAARVAFGLPPIACFFTGLSLLKIPSEAEFERLRGISIELIRSGEAGCNPNVKAIGPGSRSKNLRYMDPQTAA